ncbi:MAG: hypothetical protein ACR2NN_02695 [Bryobacteraceae bacterium]
MDLSKLFEAKSKQLFWRPLDPSHVVGLAPPQPFQKDQAYFVIRLVEMYVATARKLWHQMYPVLHSYVECGNVQHNAISGPAQLRELGDVNLDRVSNWNQVLAGPLPYDGEDVSLIAGLYSVPGHDSAKALIDTLSALSTLAGPSYAKLIPIAGVVKTGIDSVLGLDQAALHLGVCDTFSSSSGPFTPGYFVGISAPEQSVDPAQLWLVNGRLLKGSTHLTSAAYSDHDYMVIAIERLDSRDDWHTLPGVAEFLPRFGNIMSDVEFTAAEKRSRLAGLWAPFLQMLDESPQLTDPDREQIAARVGADFTRRLDAQEDGNPFLKKSA